jgi:hypothetical protein
MHDFSGILLALVVDSNANCMKHGHVFPMTFPGYPSNGSDSGKELLGNVIVRSVNGAFAADCSIFIYDKGYDIASSDRVGRGLRNL